MFRSRVADISIRDRVRQLTAGTDNLTAKPPLVQNDRIEQWGENICPNMVKGMDRIRNAALNKGKAFTLSERQALGIHGLLPPRVMAQEEQVALCYIALDKYTDDLSKYIFLLDLLERNEKLFFLMVSRNVTKMMPLVYTPTVGLACQNFSLVYRRPRGMFITIHDKGHIFDVIKNWPESDVRAIVVTDGERILGLGDLGACGMGIPIGKLALYTALGGIKPHQLVPITLDVGTNNTTMLADRFYIGLRHKRVTGKDYDDFIEEFMDAVVRRFGQYTLIQFEDFGNANAFRLLEKFRNDYCTFNDDIQGTASVVVAGILSSLKVTNTRMTDNVLVFQGAGEANLGIAELCVMAMKKEGTSDANARNKIWMVDSKGLIAKDRPSGGISSHKLPFAKVHEPVKTLHEVIKIAKPTILIGASAIAGTFTTEILQDMAKFNKTPIIFALSNPTSKAECTAEDAYKHTDGRCVFASGSPFEPVYYKDKTYHPGQGNNSYIFPGVALGVIAVGIRTIPDDIFLVSAEALSRLVRKEDLEMGNLYPPLDHIKECSFHIAAKVAEYGYKKGLASVYPEPEDKLTFVKAQTYDMSYFPAVPPVYSYPDKY